MSDTTDSSTSEAARVLAIAASALHALMAIGTATRGVLEVASPDHKVPTYASDDVLGLLRAIVAVVDTVQQGLKTGGASIADIQADIATARSDLKATLAANDAAVRAAEDAKFPPAG